MLRRTSTDPSSTNWHTDRHKDQSLPRPQHRLYCRHNIPGAVGHSTFLAEDNSPGEDNLADSSLAVVDILLVVRSNLVPGPDSMVVHCLAGRLDRHRSALAQVVMDRRGVALEGVLDLRAELFSEAGPYTLHRYLVAKSFDIGN